MNKKKLKNRLFWIVLVFVTLIIFAWERVESERLAHRIQQLEIQYREELNNKTQLQILLTKLCSPLRLGNIAGDCNLIPPKDKQIKRITISDDKN